MSIVLGVSAFGLDDQVAQAAALGTRQGDESGFFLADALLPAAVNGIILTGAAAELERFQCGLPWPPEARVAHGEWLRRAPLACVWHALVEAGDRPARWNVGSGLTFPLAQIIAAYVRDLVVGSSQDGESQRPQVVVAIPDDLDEYGQESLLRELSGIGQRDALLIWRPVAVALTWLASLPTDFELRGDNDHIHVIYLGADAIEFVTLRLRAMEHQGKRYVLPLRDRPRAAAQLAGVDWVGGLIENCWPGLDDGAFWQAFTTLPGAWEVIAGRPVPPLESPFIWGKDGIWLLWQPPDCNHEDALNIAAGPSAKLESLLTSSCPRLVESDCTQQTWGKALAERLEELLQRAPADSLRGVLVCGPLAPSAVPSWLAGKLEALRALGLRTDGDMSQPAADRLWMCSAVNPVAEGAAIYGEKRLAKIPAYLDTLPQISILAQGKGRYEWVPLLDAKEVEGGEEYMQCVKGRFSLKGGSRFLRAYLWKGSIEDAPTSSGSATSDLRVTHPKIVPCHASIIRGVVRLLKTMERVERNTFFCNTTPLASYGLSFAKTYYGLASERDNDIKVEPKVKFPLRLTVFHFPAAPEQEKRLDMNVRMKPASGLAQVEIIPQEKSFLEGRRVHLDYDSMRHASRLPILQRGWPAVQELIVDPNDTILKQSTEVLKEFLDANIDNTNFNTLIDQVRDAILKGHVQITFASLRILLEKSDENILVCTEEGNDLNLWLGVVDQDGFACTDEGNKILQDIAGKFERDFDSATNKNLTSLQDKLMTRAAWLFAATPSGIVHHIREALSDHSTVGARQFLWSVDAGSRVFTVRDDFALLFESIVKRAQSAIVTPFPIQSARAITRVLMFREEGESSMTPAMARFFAETALQTMKKLQNEGTIARTYFQIIRMFLYLLRCRRSNPKIFDPTDTSAMTYHDKAMLLMEEAENDLQNRGDGFRSSQLQRIREGLAKYRNYEASMDGLPDLDEAAGDER